jgi:tol-pal system protein YbgF
VISRHRLQLSAGVLLAAAVGAVGCVSADDIEGLHRQMNDIETQIQALERKSSSKEEVARLNSSVSEQTQQLLKSNADTGVKLGELSTAIEQLQAKLEDTNRRLSQLSQQIAETQGDLLRMRGGTSALPPGTPPGSPSTNPTSPRIGEPSTNPGRTPSDAVVRPAAGPSELYDTAYADYTKGRYALAMQGFQEYLQAYPSTDLSDNAQYWIGESHYAQKKHAEAIADFDRLLKEWPKSDKAPAALLKKGYALLELGQKAEAVVQLQYVIHEHPASEEARLARARLKTIGVEAR